MYMEEKNQNRNQNPEQQQTPHKRRVRYKGTHPRRFEEKYKELNPELHPGLFVPAGSVENPEFPLP